MLRFAGKTDVSEIRFVFHTGTAGGPSFRQQFQHEFNCIG
jgi:hypothetical protein